MTYYTMHEMRRARACIRRRKPCRSPLKSASSGQKPKAARKIWRPLFLRNVPGEERLPARVRSGTLRRAWCFLAENVRHQANFHAAVLGAAVSGAVIGSVFVFAHS